MTSLSKNFSFSNKNELKKNLKKLLKDDPTNYMDDEIYTKLMDPFNNPNSKITREIVCEELLRRTSKQTTWSGALRALMVIHKIIHKLGCQGLDPAFLGNAKSIAKFSTYKATDSSQESLLHSPHVRYYYNYLQRLSYSYEDFQVCFFPESKMPESVVNDGVSFLHFLTRLQNMLRFVMQFLPIFEVSFLKFPKMNLIRQIAHCYLSDCFYFYTYVNQALIPLLNDVFTSNKADAISVYEIYNEHILITEKLKEYYQLTRYIEEFDIKVPDFYKDDQSFHSRVQKHIKALKENTPVIKLNLLERRKIEIKALTAPNSADESQESEYSSVKGVKKILAFIQHPNEHIDSSENSPVFKSPNPCKRKSQGPFSIPKIKILKPVDKVPEKEAKVLYEMTFDPNPNLLKVPTGEDIYHTLNDSVCIHDEKEPEYVGTTQTTQSCTKTTLTVLS